MDTQERTGSLAELRKRVTSCRRCPRLVAYHEQQQRLFPQHHCAPVPPWGASRPRLMVVGLAPGLHGAGRTGRGFVGDASGAFLFAALHRHGFATSPRAEEAQLVQTCITNIVKCLPPKNRPAAEEKAACASFLREELTAFSPGPRAKPKVLLCLGGDAFQALRGLIGFNSGQFAHGDSIQLAQNLTLFSSYHPSRLNVNTGRLTQRMFDQVLADIRATLG